LGHLTFSFSLFFATGFAGQGDEACGIQNSRQLRTLTVSPTDGIMQFGIVPEEHHF
jgi:hypothetical protein